jgi:hypothetical protein
LYSRTEVLATPCPVPPRSGVYAWFFQELPPHLDGSGCVMRDGLTLLYVGISPKKPPKNGKPPSSGTLRSRIQNHFRGNAKGSTLRLTLGCLLSERLRIELRRVGSGKRRTFSTGEQLLSEWMARNAHVCWVECAEPWKVEEVAISQLCLPLNIDQNAANSFCATLKAVRSAAATRAKRLPVLDH